MKRALSLRARLTAIILTPLIVIGLIIGLWAILDARSRAEARFNRALLSAALAVSRDVAVSGGDALSPATNSLLRDTSGGQVFYHVFAPDGAFVTGYATPPVPVTETFLDGQGQQYYDGTHQTRRVRAIRFVDTMQVDGLSGDFTVTVWQDRKFLDALAGDLVRGTLLVIALLVASVACVVWFGVRYGLRPLNDLEEAIARRSSDELGVIRREVPHEVTGIVARLNTLFEQLSQSMAAQADFVSNAAHQLRNPIAGVLSLAEAVHAAPNEAEAKRRSGDLLQAARDTSELGQKLLLHERASLASPTASHLPFDLSSAAKSWADDLIRDLPVGVLLESQIDPGLRILGDETMVREAMRNLVQNALQHGGSGVSHLTLVCKASPTRIHLSLEDNGRGLPEEDLQRALTRFELISETSGSGLGLSIVDAIAKSHGGELRLSTGQTGLKAEIKFPKLAS